jgi:ABC-type glutathione transport system ATPase component
MTNAVTLLRVQGMVKEFALQRSTREVLAREQTATHCAVDNVSFDLGRGEILGLAGGSGSGKTTLARCIIRLVEPDAGTVELEGVDVRAARRGDLRELRRRMQMVFQDPYSSLNPRMSVGAMLLEAGRVHKRPGSDNGDQYVRTMLERVHLSASMAQRKPRELSGGQRQRVAVARALAVDPELLIADEAVSALDVSVQAQLLSLFLDLRDELGVAILFVAHQLAVIAEVADRVAIMNQGRLVEIGETASVFRDPQDEYTKALLAAHPHPDLGTRRAAV